MIAHVIFRLDIGGLENGLVNLINRTPPHEFRHAIICVTCATSFRQRIKTDDVIISELHKKPGKDIAIYWRFLQELRKLRPDVVHTRNVNTMEFHLIAALAGVRARIHGEHGWDMHDLHGRNRKYRILRKMLRRFVNQFIVVSEDLCNYLISTIRVPAEKIVLIYNGVDTRNFRPRMKPNAAALAPESDDSPIVIGTIGRMQEVKNQRLLAEAFAVLVNDNPDRRNNFRLLIIGDGPLRQELVRKLAMANAAELCSMPGACDNIAQLLSGIDIFVLPSKNEGISNTILEAMATGLPVVATRVGGNSEIVQDGVTGTLVKVDDVAEMSLAILDYVDNPEKRRSHGDAGRRRVERHFSLDSMVSRYMAVYRNSTS